MKDTALHLRTKSINYKHHGCTALDTPSLMRCLMVIADASKEEHTKNNIDKLIGMITRFELT